MGTKPRKSTRAGKRAARRSNNRPRWPQSCLEQLQQVQVILIGARATAQVLEEAFTFLDEAIVIHRHIVQPLTEALEALGYEEGRARAPKGIHRRPGSSEGRS